VTTAPRTVHLRAADGTRLAADELPGAEPAFLFLHGLASNRLGEKSSSLLAWAERRGLRLLRLDFRGHGESEGRLADLTLSRVIEDAEAGLDHLGRAVVVGSSLGGLVGAWLAARHPDRVLGLVLLAPAFGFLARMAKRPRRQGRVLVESAWVRTELNDAVLGDARAWPEDELPGRIRAPTLVVHGSADDVVAADDVERAFAALRAPKELWIVPGGDHRLTGAIEDVWPRMERLLAGVLGGQGEA